MPGSRLKIIRRLNEARTQQRPNGALTLRSNLTREDWVFISYETKDALNLARLAKMRLSLCGHRGWVWQDDKEVGERTRAEIASKIIQFDHFLYICTKRSHASEPQGFERELALQQQKRPLVIAFRTQHVSPELSVANQIRTTNVDFQRACDQAGSVFCARREVELEAAEETEGEELVLPATLSDGGIEQIEHS